jgi:hypothetical protein
MACGDLAIGTVNARNAQEHFFDEYAFAPLRSEIKAGRNFRWTNYGEKPHSIVAADGQEFRMLPQGLRVLPQCQRRPKLLS